MILIYSTLQNINRAQLLMEKFLLDKGETIMRSIEAGNRATMRHHMGSGNPLHSLLAEYAKDQDIHYIIIRDSDGKIIDHVGAEDANILSLDDLHSIFLANTPVTNINQNTGIYSISKKFKAVHSTSGSHMQLTTAYPPLSEKDDREILTIGLKTEQFDIARKQDIRHAIFMGAILFLISTAGLYFLFLYQKMRKTSSNLADMKLYTENVLESIPVGVITLDAASQIVSCNRNAEEFFDLPLSVMKGKNIYDALPGLPLPLLSKSNNILESESLYTDNKGRAVPLRTSCSPLVHNDSEEIGKVLILKDMSSIKAMELQLERSRRMAALGKMAAGIAHEIRNPLGTLRGFAQFFGSQPESTEDGKNYSALMISEIDRLNQTISGLLQFSRPREPQTEIIEIDQFFDKTVSLMAADFSAKDINLKQSKNNGIRIKADPDLLLQVMMNLLKNSINAVSSGGVISLTCREDDFFTLITVSDNGCGMSEEVRQKMFDPFFTTIRSGTGLGLAVSHQIIEQHNGTFEVHTEPNSGTTISISLPK